VSSATKSTVSAINTFMSSPLGLGTSVDDPSYAVNMPPGVEGCSPFPDSVGALARSRPNMADLDGATAPTLP
jgi:hypothetical protein